MRILLVEYNHGIADLIQKGLSEQGCHVDIAYDGFTGKERVRNNEYDLVILDVMLPFLNGMELCRQIRVDRSDLPILMLSPLKSMQEMVAGLESGADDYMMIPFDFEELLARVHALHRRKLQPGLVFFHKVADLEVEVLRRTVRRAGKLIMLTSTEFSLLELLIANKNKPLSKGFISASVWGIHFDRGTNLVAVYINTLRAKIDKGFQPQLILTVFREGYMLKEP